MLDELANFIFTSKYARYNDKLKRRETWEEAVSRVESMHLKRFAHLSDDDKKQIKKAFDLVREKRVIPSMRSMQFGGSAVESHEARIFNCCVRHVDSIRSFTEIFYLLLCGCGVGIGLSNRFLTRIPDLVTEEDRTFTVLTYVVEDSIEGWADSLQALMNCYFKNTAYTGRKIVFDYSRIRRKGTRLKTGGGKAPGYKPLKNTHERIKTILDNIIKEKHQTRMKSIDAYDILMHAADSVISGGSRRSATCVIFDKDDEDMMTSKTGDWMKDNPQRGRSNNSVLLLRGRITKDEFTEIVKHTKQWGEPGFVFANHKNVLFNPCFEISFIPVTKDGLCGVQFCNLTSINGAKIKNVDQFRDATWAAVLIGTLQAAYTNFPFLGKESEILTKEEALLGVSITGIMDAADILLDKYTQKEMAKYSIVVNKEWSEKIGINQAARITCVKPEGTSSLALGCSSGIHPHHAHKYFRRVQINKEDNVYQYFKKHNPHMCEPCVWSVNKTDDVIAFPLTIPSKATTKDQLTAIEHLEIIKSTQQYWVIPGTTDVNRKDIHHNVSCTVIVKEKEWDEVIEYIHKNRDHFTAVSLLSESGDKDYPQAPMEKVANDADKKKFDELYDRYKFVDYTKLIEDHDETALQQNIACSGGKCELI